MFREVDIDAWNRRSTYEFFRDYKDPYFNIAANLDVTRLYTYCKSHGLSFAIAALFFSLETVNAIREFRVRLLEDKVVEFDEIHATQTILNDDETFSFCYFPRQASLIDFEKAGRQAVEKYKALKTFDVESDRIDLVYYSVIPWVSFTSFKHATRGDNRMSVPRMVFGRIFDEGGGKKMPFSVEVHHALMDGIHVGRYFELFQENLDSIR
jgi:chloramphenicol O-acetyltransferase type A